MRATSPTLAPDAAIALGIASTAMPFARTPEAILERWLRILRLYGEAGAALQALGVAEGRLEAEEAGHGGTPSSEEGSPQLRELVHGDDVRQVADRAQAIASERGSELVTTTDLLLAVIRLYEADFDRVLRAHGGDRGELLQRLDVGFASC